jgi:hypothetical protein
MVYVVDIDETICTNKNIKYGESVPYVDRIKRLNYLYDQGHTIIYCTARGMGRYKNIAILAKLRFYYLTYTQLKKWGVKFNKLMLGKPAGDLYIDDKGIRDGDFFKDEICP